MITFSAAEHAKDSATAWDREDLKNFNAIVLYDMPMKITDVQKAKVLTLFGRGVGLVVLHHALVSFQDWPDYERIIGGRWPQPPKGQPKINDKVGYQHDVEVPVVITDKNHPVTSGLKDVSVRDEIYWGGGPSRQRRASTAHHHAPQIRQPADVDADRGQVADRLPAARPRPFRLRQPELPRTPRPQHHLDHGWEFLRSLVHSYLAPVRGALHHIRMERRRARDTL